MLRKVDPSKQDYKLISDLEAILDPKNINLNKKQAVDKMVEITKKQAKGDWDKKLENWYKDYYSNVKYGGKLGKARLLMDNIGEVRKKQQGKLEKLLYGKPDRIGEITDNMIKAAKDAPGIFKMLYDVNRSTMAYRQGLKDKVERAIQAQEVEEMSPEAQRMYV
jgi:hypothetical protein